MWFRTLFLTLIAIYMGGLGVLYFFQRSILYQPEHFYVPPGEAHADPAFHELTVKTEDGLDLKGWYAPATTKLYTLVFFHGNADNLRSLVGIAPPYIRAGYGMLFAEYRGYSGEPGAPAEQGLYADARAYVEALLAAGIPEKSLVFFGHSLGTGVALQMATEFKPRALLLMAPFLSMGKVAQYHYPIFPADFLVKDRYDNSAKIKQVNGPLLIGHGIKDSVVPFTQGKALFEQANEPKEFYPLPEAGHNDLFAQGFFEISLAWLNRLSKPKSP